MVSKHVRSLSTLILDVLLDTGLHVLLCVADVIFHILHSRQHSCCGMLHQIDTCLSYNICRKVKGIDISGDLGVELTLEKFTEILEMVT